MLKHFSCMRMPSWSWHFSLPLIILLLFNDHAVVVVETTVFDMHFKSIGSVRTDPILDQQCLSGHVHTFYGAPALWSNTTYEDLRSFHPYQVSGNIEENHSLYWHPSIYRVVSTEADDGDNSTLYYELQETELSVYYVWDPRIDDLRTFVPGFTMIAGGRNKIHENADFRYECERFGDDEEESLTSSETFPMESCEGPGTEFFIEFRMPNCWNGLLRSDDDSHVTYSLDGGNDIESPCPEGYSKIPQIWLFIEFPNGYKGGKHVYSDGEDQYLHVDYFSGWDETQLQNALENCGNDNDGNDREEFGPIGGSRCPNQFHYKNEALCLGEDARYEPNETFNTTSFISSEPIDNVLELPKSLPKNLIDGSCALSDQPIEVSPTTTMDVFVPPNYTNCTYIDDDEENDDEDCGFDRCFVELEDCVDEVDEEEFDNCVGDTSDAYQCYENLEEFGCTEEDDVDGEELVCDCFEIELTCLLGVDPNGCGFVFTECVDEEEDCGEGEDEGEGDCDCFGRLEDCVEDFNEDSFDDCVGDASEAFQCYEDSCGDNDADCDCFRIELDCLLSVDPVGCAPAYSVCNDEDCASSLDDGDGED